MFQKVDIKEVNETLPVNKLNINLAGDSKGQAFSENSALPEDAAAGLQKIHIKDAGGTVLAHDLTRIVPGKSKGPAYRKGHIVQQDDIPELLKIGKEHLYVLNLSGGLLHEDDAALRIANAVFVIRFFRVSFSI